MAGGDPGRVHPGMEAKRAESQEHSSASGPPAGPGLSLWFPVLWLHRSPFPRVLGSPV